MKHTFGETIWTGYSEWKYSLSFYIGNFEWNKKEFHLFGLRVTKDYIEIRFLFICIFWIDWGKLKYKNQ